MTLQRRVLVALGIALAAPGIAASTARAETPQRMASLDSVSQGIDTTGLGTGAAMAPGLAMGTGGLPAAALVVQAHARVLRPAPLPDQDVDAPGPDAGALAEEQQASIQPSFYGAPKQNFSGDGYASGSSLDGNVASRRRPGGGMSLSIPVQ